MPDLDSCLKSQENHSSPASSSCKYSKSPTLYKFYFAHDVVCDEANRNTLLAQMETPAPSSSSSNPSLDNQKVNVDMEWEDYKAWASTAAHEGKQFSVNWLLDLWKVRTITHSHLLLPTSSLVQGTPI